jgi:hypothetical protein
MTHTASGSRDGVPKAWLVPIVVLVGILLAAAIGWLSRSVVVDFVAWWPLWVAIGAIAVFARARKVGRVRVAGLVPLLATACLGLFLIGHLQGWGAMPSSSASLVGPEPGVVTGAALSARIDGRVEVGASDTGFLYTVVPIRTGGTTGLPEAVERTQGAAISVFLEPVDSPGIYTFAGWDIDLDPAPTWNLSLGGRLEADLSSLRLTELQVEGSGTVTLGAPIAETPVRVSGDHVIQIPEGVAARVVGQAAVPEDWVQTADGWTSPSGGGGWVISVSEGATLEITGA